MRSPWTSFVVVPLFALANAGIELSAAALERAFTSPLAIGVVVGLVLGKPIGITAGAWLATRRPLGAWPLAVPWPSLVATASVGGIGFTVSLLIAELSYSGAMLEDAKLGILGGSITAALVGSGLLRALTLLRRNGCGGRRAAWRSRWPTWTCRWTPRAITSAGRWTPA